MRLLCDFPTSRPSVRLPSARSPSMRRRKEKQPSEPPVDDKLCTPATQNVIPTPAMEPTQADSAASRSSADTIGEALTIAALQAEKDAQTAEEAARAASHRAAEARKKCSALKAAARADALVSIEASPEAQCVGSTEASPAEHQAGPIHGSPDAQCVSSPKHRQRSSKPHL